MKNPEETPPRPNNFQARIFSKLQRFAIPVTAKWLGKLICMAILPSAEPLAIAPAMLKQKNFSPRPANSFNFCESSYWVWKGARRK
jgi:hypothetical protein